jgi:hypothetical protein
MLDQAVQQFGTLFGGTILKQRTVSKTVIDVETTFEVVRIIQADNGSITLAGWNKQPRQTLTGVWSASTGWRVGSAATVCRSNLFPKV